MNRHIQYYYAIFRSWTWILIVVLLIIGIGALMITRRTMHSIQNLRNAAQKSAETINDLDQSVLQLYTSQVLAIHSTSEEERFSAHRSRVESEHLIEFHLTTLERCAKLDNRVLPHVKAGARNLMLMNDSIWLIINSDPAELSLTHDLYFRSQQELVQDLLDALRENMYMLNNMNSIKKLEHVTYAIIGSIGILLCIAFVGTMNVVYKRRMELNLHQSEARIKSIFNAAKTIAFIISESKAPWKMIEASPGSTHVLGFSRQEIVGKGVLSLFPPNSEGILDTMAQKCTNKNIFHGQLDLVNKEGQAFPVVFAASPLEDLLGNVESILFVAIDITKLKQAENEVRAMNSTLMEKNSALHAMNERLSELDKAKSEFVSMASHEFRTPLTSIIGMAQTLQMHAIDLDEQERNRFLEIIISEGKRMAEMVQQFLSLSKIEKGILVITRERFDFIELINECIQIINPPESATISIESELNEVECNADRNRMKQVIINLLDNAIRYSESSVQIRVIVMFLPKKGLRVDISDNGPGISEEDQKHLFERFFRGKYATTSKKGSGLGLTISRTIIEAHGGQINVLSQPGKGTNFYFVLPCA